MSSRWARELTLLLQMFICVSFCHTYLSCAPLLAQDWLRSEVKWKWSLVIGCWQTKKFPDWVETVEVWWDWGCCTRSVRGSLDLKTKEQNHDIYISHEIHLWNTHRNLITIAMSHHIVSFYKRTVNIRFNWSYIHKSPDTYVLTRILLSELPVSRLLLLVTVENICGNVSPFNKLLPVK